MVIFVSLTEYAEKYINDYWWCLDAVKDHMFDMCKHPVQKVAPPASLAAAVSKDQRQNCDDWVYEEVDWHQYVPEFLLNSFILSQAL